METFLMPPITPVTASDCIVSHADPRVKRSGHAQRSLPVLRPLLADVRFGDVQRMRDVR